MEERSKILEQQKLGSERNYAVLNLEHKEMKRKNEELLEREKEVCRLVFNFLHYSLAFNAF